MPLSTARAKKPAASASDTRFEIVMVKRSLAAANAIKAGNSRRRAISRIMGSGSPCEREVGASPPSLAARGEQSGNAGHQTVAIRKTRTKSASTSAIQTTSTGAASLLPAGGDAFLAVTEAAAGLRMFTPSPSAQTTKASVIPRPLPLACSSRSFQRAVDRGELGVQVGAEAVDHSDDRERNAGGNQAVFDRGGAGLVLHETRNQVLHG